MVLMRSASADDSSTSCSELPIWIAQSVKKLDGRMPSARSVYTPKPMIAGPHAAAYSRARLTLCVSKYRLSPNSPSETDTKPLARIISRTRYGSADGQRDPAARYVVPSLVSQRVTAGIRPFSARYALPV